MITSSICRPMRRVGLRAVMGSWKIIAASRPRTLSRSFSRAVSMSRPRMLRLPLLTWYARSGNRRRLSIAVTDLPEPDSPITPTISPGLTCSDTPLRAFTVLLYAANSMLRLSMANTGVSPSGRFSVSRCMSFPLLAWVEQVAYAIAQEVEAGSGDQDRHAGKGRVPPLIEDVIAPGGDHGAPLRRRLLRAQADKAQRRRHENGTADVQAQLHQQRRHGVARHVPQHHVPAAGAKGFGGLYVTHLANA